MTESAVILIAALRADADALILVAAAEAADCIVLLARQIGKLSGLRLLLQNCKKGLCLAFLFSAMFLTGWEIAGMRSRQTKETAAVAYEAGNWGLGFGAEGTQPTGNATSAELAQYDAHYVGDPSGKVLYLTFDCGYENG